MSSSLTEMLREASSRHDHLYPHHYCGYCGEEIITEREIQTGATLCCSGTNHGYYFIKPTVMELYSTESKV